MKLFCWTGCVVTLWLINTWTITNLFVVIILTTFQWFEENLYFSPVQEHLWQSKMMFTLPTCMFIKQFSYNTLLDWKRCTKSIIKMCSNRIKVLLKIYANNKAHKNGSTFMICSNNDQCKKKNITLKNNPWVFHAV